MVGFNYTFSILICVNVYNPCLFLCSYSRALYIAANVTRLTKELLLVLLLREFQR